MVATRSKSKAAKSEASKSETSKVFEKKPWTYWLSNEAVLREARKCFSLERFNRSLSEDNPAKKCIFHYTYLRNKEWNSLSDSDKEYFIDKALSIMAFQAPELFARPRAKLIDLYIRKPKGKGKKRWTVRDLYGARCPFMHELYETYMSDPKTEDLAKSKDFYLVACRKWNELTEAEKDVYVLKRLKLSSDFLEANDHLIQAVGSYYKPPPFN
ncbi:unnamed protein product [Amaranthus hypochondriacus]